MTKIFGASMVAIIAVVFLVSAQDAFAAESPNVLVGQNLTIGSTGSEVAMLQALLSEMGYLNIPVGIAPGYYGPLTKSAVASYQSRENVTPAIGFYGPITKVAMHADFASHNWLSILGW